LRPFWKHTDRDLEKQLNAFRADPPRGLVDELEARVTAKRTRVPVRRLGLSVALVAALLIPFGAFGGFGYASSATKSTFTVLTGVHFGKVTKKAPVTKSSPKSSSSTQYGHCPRKSPRPCPPGQNPPPPPPKPPKGPNPCPHTTGHPCKP
jgi:hypothetical protein